MRHVCAPFPKALRSLGMLQAPLRAALVAPGGFAQRVPASQRGASLGAVDLPTVAVRADIHVLVATRAAKEASCIVRHRSELGRRALDKRASGVLHWLRTVLVTVGGTAFGLTATFGPVPCPVLFGDVAVRIRRPRRRTPAGGALFTGRART
jgi:hypothetical protein